MTMKLLPKRILGDYETLRIGFDGREEYVEISGNGNITIDRGNTGSTIGVFHSGQGDYTKSVHQTLDESRLSQGKAPGYHDTGTIEQCREYMDILIQLQHADHNVHAEIEDTLKKMRVLYFGAVEK